MMEDFRQRMYSVNKIVDCADCEKCRLWGKLQTTGLATAVRIILTPIECLEKDINFSINRDQNNDNDNNNYNSSDKCENFSLNRGEIVALYNSFARLSQSVDYVEQFKVMLFEERGKTYPGHDNFHEHDDEQNADSSSEGFSTRRSEL